MFVLDYPLHVGFVHHEINGASRLQSVAGVLNAAAPIFRNLIQVASAGLGFGHGPCNDNAPCFAESPFLQNGRARNIRVDVEVDPQVLADAFDDLERFLTSAEILLSSDLVMR